MNNWINNFANFLADKNAGLAKYNIDLIDVVLNNYRWTFPISKQSSSDILKTLNKNIEEKQISSDVEKILFSRKFISENFESLPPEDIVKFATVEWGRTLKDNQKNRNTINCYSNLVEYIKINQLTKIDTIDRIFDFLVKNKHIDGIASWSKILAVINPHDFFVYDFRIHQALNLFWSLYCLNNKLNEDFPFVLTNPGRNARATFVDIILDINKKNKRTPKGKASSNKTLSYINYCTFIKKLSDLTFNCNKNILPSQHVQNPNDTPYQLTEMALFSLMGSSEGTSSEEIRERKADFIFSGDYKTDPVYEPAPNLLKSAIDAYLNAIIKK